VLRSSRFHFLRSRTVWIAGVAVLAITVLGFALYLSFRPQPSSATPSVAGSAVPSAIGLAPTAPAVGGRTVTTAASVELLTVVASSPTSGSSGAPANTAIDLSFNLPVDPAAAESYFSVLPSVPGSFSQGPTPMDVVFTPSVSFGPGSSVNVVLRKGYTSRDGYPLQDDFGFSFITAVSSRDVLFQAGDQVARVYSAQSGRSVMVTLQFGAELPSDLELETFRATASDLLAAQVHDENGAYLDEPIATAEMESVAKEGVANGGSYTITQPDGVYLLLVGDNQGQYGAMWIVFSKFGVILRQDDQKIVVAGQDLTTGSTTPTFDISFYNLQENVQSVLAGSFTGTAEFAASFPAPIDLAVATSGGEDVVIPVLVPQTGADIKVVGDLSTQPQIYLTTDRAGYQKGDTVKFAGVLRISNDQAYTLPTGMTVAVWSGYGTSKLVHTSPVAANGTFSGSFDMPADAFNPDGTDGQMTLYAGTLDQAASDVTPFFTLIAALGNHAPAASISITFDEATYVASDMIVASVSGVDNSGKPLAAKSVRLSVYSAAHLSQPIELDSFAVRNTWGLPVQEDVGVTLDANGHATYAFKANVAKKAADQDVTLTATYGSGLAAAIGARTAIVYQAANEIHLLPSRSVYQPGDNVIAPFVVETTAGQRVGSVPVTYQFDRTDYAGSNVTTTVVASGTLTTDANGRGTVRTTYSGPVGAVILRIKGKDAAGNAFERARPMTITSGPASLLSLGAPDSLTQLSVIADKLAYTTGDEAQLIVTSPAAQDVFLSVERGRIHLYRWVSLAQGENALPLTISPDLAPGFTLTFSYFRDGLYVTEGLPIRINNSDRLLRLTVAPDQATYAPGQTAHVTITVADGTGAPVAATLLVDGYDAIMSANKLVDVDSIAGTFFAPAARGTNGSSSLLGVGSWGGRCGVAFVGPQPAATIPGNVVVWLTDVRTDANGTATIDVPIGQGSVRLAVFAATSTTSFGQAQLDLDVR
jgi:uncharacterized protein YfaS (alpha-2-macroglobulin family)